jgi:hypothetical protein
VLEKRLILEDIATAERHVERTTRHIEEQEVRIAEMERHGYDTESSRYLLDTFHECLRLHLESRERLRHELAALS